MLSFLRYVVFWKTHIEPKNRLAMDGHTDFRTVVVMQFVDSPDPKMAPTSVFGVKLNIK